MDGLKIFATIIIIFVLFFVSISIISIITIEEEIVIGNIQNIEYLERDWYFDLDKVNLTFDDGRYYITYLDEGIFYDFTNRSIIIMRLTRNYIQRTWGIESMAKYGKPLG